MQHALTYLRHSCEHMTSTHENVKCLLNWQLHKRHPPSWRIRKNLIVSTLHSLPTKNINKWCSWRTTQWETSNKHTKNKSYGENKSFKRLSRWAVVVKTGTNRNLWQHQSCKESIKRTNSAWRSVINRQINTSSATVAYPGFFLEAFSDLRGRRTISFGFFFLCFPLLKTKNERFSKQRLSLNRHMLVPLRPGKQRDARRGLVHKFDARLRALTSTRICLVDFLNSRNGKSGLSSQLPTQYQAYIAFKSQHIICNHTVAFGLCWLKATRRGKRSMWKPL